MSKSSPTPPFRLPRRSTQIEHGPRQGAEAAEHAQLFRLGLKARDIDQLERLVDRLRQGPAHFRERTGRERRIAGDLRPLEQALKALIQVLRSLNVETAKTLQSFIDSRRRSSPERSPFAAQAPAALSRVAGHTLFLVRQLIRKYRPMGRPPKLDRELDALLLGAALSRHGVTPSRGRGGPFARALMHLLDAAGHETPEDMFDLLRTTVKDLEEMGVIPNPPSTRSKRRGKSRDSSG